MVTNRTTLFLIIAVTLAVPSFAADAITPNIVFILADDLGIGNVGCYGSDNYQTRTSTSLQAPAFGAPTPTRQPSVDLRER